MQTIPPGPGKTPKAKSLPHGSAADYLMSSWSSFRGGREIRERAAMKEWPGLGIPELTDLQLLGMGRIFGSDTQMRQQAASGLPGRPYMGLSAFGLAGYDPETFQILRPGYDSGVDLFAGANTFRPGRRSPWSRIRNQFGGNEAAQIASAGLSGGLGGMFGAAGSIAGGAFGPIGSLLGGLLGGGIGKLFGHKNKNLGLSPAQPIYTRDVGVMEVLSQLLNVTKGQLIGGTGAGINRATAQLALQGARV